jgi:DNA-binding transcriptional LysR family regulator
MDRLTSMSVFVKVADLGSFSAAAKELRLSPTMIGKHMRHLEGRLGSLLINRSTRRQNLTELGRNYLDHCRRLLEEAEAGDALAEEALTAPRGRLRVAAPIAFGAHSAMMSRSLSPYTAIVCASPEYLAERGMPAHPKDLVDHDCLSFPDWTEGPRWSFFGPEGEVHVDIKSRLQINNGFGIRYAALAGAGIVMQRTELVAEDIAAGRLQALLTGYKAQSRPRHIVWLQNRKVTPKLRAFIDFVVEVYG